MAPKNSDYKFQKNTSLNQKLAKTVVLRNIAQ